MGKCRKIEPAEQAVEDYEFLTSEESEAFARSLPRPTVGTYLNMFIWQYEYGRIMDFAAKVGYHPNSVYKLTSANRPISVGLFRRMVGIYRLSKEDREFWGRGLLGL